MQMYDGFVYMGKKRCATVGCVVACVCLYVCSNIMYIGMMVVSLYDCVVVQEISSAAKEKRENIKIKTIFADVFLPTHILK